MTNFEITYNLFKNLNKFEQKEIVKQFLDKMFDKPLEKIPKLSEKLPFLSGCTNFFRAVDECCAIIITEDEDETNELVQLFNNSIPNGCQSYSEYDIYQHSHKLFTQLCFNIERYSLQVNHPSEYNPDTYKIISYTDFKNSLEFFPQ